MDDDVAARAYAGFAPSLQLFAQYASENAKLFNCYKAHSRRRILSEPNRNYPYS
jgi:hypothetical protein